MKVLYVSKFDLPDFQSDMIFHGLRSLLGEDCVDMNDAWYMYDDFRNYWTDRVPGRGMEYGRGFTLYGRLPRLNIDRTDIESKIQNHYFDKIVYGSSTRCNTHFTKVLEHYGNKDIIFVDGEDNTVININFLSLGVYYKRELVEKTSLVKPIQFCIPKELIVKDVPNKVKDYATIIPGDKSTYIYTEETPYYKDYQESYFGVTTKKGGWDCLRHYEILMNGCIPYFPGLENCPHNTMANFPKQKIIETNNFIEKGIPILDFYYDSVLELLNHTRKHLTTEAVAKKLLE